MENGKMNIIMKRQITYGLLAALMACGCQEEELNLKTSEPKSFTASIEDNYSGGSTKTTLDENGNVLWEKGDQVSIFAGSTINEQYQITDDSDGKTSANLNSVSTSTGFVAGTDFGNNVAYYPYSSNNAIAKSKTAYKVSVVLPSTQTYAEASFANGAFPMAAITSSTNDMNLKFKNVLGGLKLQLKGTASVSSISISGNNNEILYGAANVSVSTANIPSVVLTDASAKTITLNCGDGVQLNTTDATPFIIALPPMTMASGFTVIVKDTEGKQMKIKTQKSQTITRSSLLKMPTVNYVGEESDATNGHEYVDLGIRKSLLDGRITPGSKYDRKIVFATCNIGAERPEDFGYYFRWGELNGWKVISDKEQPNSNILSAIQCNKDGTELHTIWTLDTFSEAYPLNDRLDVEDFQGKTDLQCNSTIYGDAATYNWGGAWKTPDNDILQTLFWISFSQNTTKEIGNYHNGYITLNYSFTDCNGIRGILIKNSALGTSLFLPAAGFCFKGQFLSGDPYNSVGNLMSSSPYSSTQSGIMVLEFYSLGLGTVRVGKGQGTPVRPMAELTLTDEIPDPISLPSVGNVIIQDIDYVSVSVSSNLTNDGNAITERGFYYGTSENSLTKNVKVSGYEIGNFSKQITGLYPGTTYFIKAYATNEAGTIESDVISFTTKSVSGELNGHKWVDIGIRKSHIDSKIEPGSTEDRKIVFAAQNIGTKQSNLPGYYFRGGELYGWEYSGSTNANNKVELTSTNLKQVDKDGNTIKVFEKNKYHAIFDYEYDDDYAPDDYKKNYDTGDAVKYYYGDEWQMIPYKLASKLELNTPREDKLPTSGIADNTNFNGITLEYIFSSRGLEIRNKEWGSSIFLRSAGNLSAENRCDYWQPSGGYWINGGPYRDWYYYDDSMYFGAYKDGYDYDPESEKYTKFHYYWGLATGGGNYVWNAQPIRAVAELPL